MKKRGGREAGSEHVNDKMWVLLDNNFISVIIAKGIDAYVLNAYGEDEEGEDGY